MLVSAQTAPTCGRQTWPNQTWLTEAPPLGVEAEVEVWLRASHDPASLRRWLLLAARVERAEALIDAESGSKSASGPLPG